MKVLVTVPTKDTLLSKVSVCESEPFWCLPPQFWDRARVFDGYTVYPLGDQVGMPVRKCHTSSLKILDVDLSDQPGVILEYATGYAESEGIWYRHSWIVNQNEKILLETTPNTFIAYFGVVLTQKELGEFREMMEWTGDHQ